MAKSAPDVLLGISDVATRAALKLTPAVPIVGLSSDMVGAGLVRSLAHPGGSITGIRRQRQGRRRVTGRLPRFGRTGSSSTFR